MVQVPELLELSVDEAHDVALDAGLLAVDHSDSGPTTTTADRASAPPQRVYCQELPAGAMVPTGTRIGIWARRPDDPGPDDDSGGGGGPDLVPTGPEPQLGGGTK
ncbi:hypothetical protein AD006_29415 (plasmid) [Pseudonocardia sp. EC080610-09]|nr:hypothetical protein AD006_29415 [Pseudonocardia sp. EC080610-09]